MFPNYDIPSWYDLSIKETTLQILVRSDIFESFVSNGAKYRFISNMEELSGAKLIMPTDFTKGEFGFGPLCTYQPSQRDNWILCEIALPPYDQPARPYACTLSFLLDWLDYFGLKQTDAPPTSQPIPTPQLMTVSIEWAGTGLGKYGLWAAISPALSSWVAKQPVGEHEEISQAIKTVAQHTWSERMRDNDYYLNRCRAGFDAYNGVCFGCEGDACDLSSGGAQNSKPNPGAYTLGPHNVDSFSQQFLLLTGAVKLCEVARREIG